MSTRVPAVARLIPPFPPLALTPDQQRRISAQILDALVSGTARPIARAPAGFRQAPSFVYFRGQPGTRTDGMLKTAYVVRGDVYLHEQNHGFGRWQRIGPAQLTGAR